MNILIVSAYDNPQSLVGTLHNTALGVLQRLQHSISVTELYTQQFNPVASKIGFATSSGANANYMFEQQRAVNTGTGFSPDIASEMEKVSAAELVIFHFPLWWGAPPAILKGWLERVLAMGFAWGSDARFEKGLMRGKRVLLTVTVGDPEFFYSPDGMHRATVEQHLYPLTHNTLAFCGFDVLRPFVVANVTAAGRQDIETAIARYREHIEHIDSATYLFRHATKQSD